ncbi:hypothetical protein [Sinomonas sp. RB5]
MSGKSPSESTERNQRRFLAAADRLLGGRAEASDGQLTLKSLADEAGVPRVYLYRGEYKPIAEDFLRRAELARLADENPDRRAAQIELLRTELGEAKNRLEAARKKLVEVHEQIRRAASQIIYFTEQNRMLREQLEEARKVIRLSERRERQESDP